MDRSTQRAKYGAPYVTIHRADLHEVLTRAARNAGVDLRTNANVVSSQGTTRHAGRRQPGSKAMC